jgi:predicted NAD-dependent protein-ADP-ribosyltransferase YbiA (DUF1768 family)
MADAVEPPQPAGLASAPAPAPAPAAPPAEFKLPVAYEKPVLDSITTFFKKRARNLKDFTFTPDGNLQMNVKGQAGEINLKRFLPLEPSERAALEEFRLDTLADLEEQYEKERVALSAAWQEYYTTGNMRGVLSANQRVAELDARRAAVRSLVRNVVAIDNPATREILLSERYEERKMFDKKDPFEKEVARLCIYDFLPEYDQGKYVIDQKVAEVEAAAEEAAAGEPALMAYQQTLKDGRKARVFFDTDSDVNGFLSPMWPIEFTMDDDKTGEATRYFTALQAYEAERAKELGQLELRASLLKTRSARTIRIMTRKVVGHPADARGLWLKIFTAIFQPGGALTEKLLATGTDALVFADVRDGPSGIGLGEKDSSALDPAKWKGENAVGVALETVRTRLREGNLDEAPEAENVAEAVITEDEQQKAKVGAIIAARRGGGGKFRPG